MESRFQFSVRNILVAITVLAVWCAVVFAGFRRLPNVQGARFVSLLIVLIVATLPATAVGAMQGRAGFGALCGVAGGLGMILFSLFGR